MARGRKLYYDVLLAGTGRTSVTVSPTLQADRDGNLLDALPPPDGNASAGDRQRRELSVFFHLYDSDASAFLLVAVNDQDGNPYDNPFDPPPDDAAYAIGGLQTNSSRGPGLQLVFNRDVDPTSVTTSQIEQEPDPSFPPTPAGPESMFLYYDDVAGAAVPFVVAVVGNMITITRADDSQWGTGPDPFNPIPGTGGVIGIHLTAGILASDGTPLENPGNIFWASFIVDD